MLSSFQSSFTSKITFGSGAGRIRTDLFRIHIRIQVLLKVSDPRIHNTYYIRLMNFVIVLYTLNKSFGNYRWIARPAEARNRTHRSASS
jgi:hypothetical protein